MTSVLVLSAALCLDFAAKLVQECTFNCPDSSLRRHHHHQHAQKLIGNRVLTDEDYDEDSPFLNLTFIDFYTRLWDVYKYGNETTDDSHSIFDFNDAEFKVADDNESIVFLFHMENATAAAEGGAEKQYTLNENLNMTDQELSARLLQIIYDDAESLEELDKMMSELEDEGLEDEEEEKEDEEYDEDEDDGDMEEEESEDYVLVDHTFRKTSDKKKFVPKRTDDPNNDSEEDNTPIKDPESAYEHNRRVMEKEVEFLSRRPSERNRTRVSSSKRKKSKSTTTTESSSNRSKSKSTSTSKTGPKTKSKSSSRSKSKSGSKSRKRSKSKKSKKKSSGVSSISPTSQRRMEVSENRWQETGGGSRRRYSSASGGGPSRRKRRLTMKGKLQEKMKQLTEKLMNRKNYRHKRPPKVSKKKEYLVPALLGLGSLLGFGFGTVYVDRELNNFTFNPTITYEGDNETLSVFDRDTFSNTQLQDTNVAVMTANTNSQSNSFAQTTIPVSVNSDGKMDFLLLLINLFLKNYMNGSSRIP